jgi:hypothetical protein
MTMENIEDLSPKQRGTLQNSRSSFWENKIRIKGFPSLMWKQN